MFVCVFVIKNPDFPESLFERSEKPCEGSEHAPRRAPEILVYKTSQPNVLLYESPKSGYLFPRPKPMLKNKITIKSVEFEVEVQV